MRLFVGGAEHYPGWAGVQHIALGVGIVERHGHHGMLILHEHHLPGVTGSPASLSSW